MKKIITFAFAFFLINQAIAQQVNFLPPGAVNIRHTPEAAPNKMIAAHEQRGLISYKGRSCDDVSLAFVESTDGKQYGNNEWVDVHVKVLHYKPDAKTIWDMMLKMSHPSTALQSKLDNFKADQAAQGTSANFKMQIVDVQDGKMLIINQHNVCSMSKYKEYTDTYFYSYAIVGTTVVDIDGGYNNDKPELAKKLHSEVVEKLKKTGVN